MSEPKKNKKPKIKIIPENRKEYYPYFDASVGRYVTSEIVADVEVIEEEDA